MKEATEPTRFFDPETGGTMVLQLEPDGAPSVDERNRTVEDVEPVEPAS